MKPETGDRKPEALAFDDSFRLMAMQANVQPNFYGFYPMPQPRERKLINVTPVKDDFANLRASLRLRA